MAIPDRLGQPGAGVRESIAIILACRLAPSPETTAILSILSSRVVHRGAVTASFRHENATCRIRGRRCPWTGRARCISTIALPVHVCWIPSRSRTVCWARTGTFVCSRTNADVDRRGASPWTCTRAAHWVVVPFGKCCSRQDRIACAETLPNDIGGRRYRLPITIAASSLVTSPRSRCASAIPRQDSRRRGAEAVVRFPPNADAWTRAASC